MALCDADCDAVSRSSAAPCYNPSVVSSQVSTLTQSAVASVDIGRVDLLIQYALLVAGENDEPNERQLGPIHLIKYVYLGDLAFARRNDGRTYTGISWQFYKFGPWSQEVNQRIQPALLAIGAAAVSYESRYEGKEEWVRWSLRDDDLLREKERALPVTITMNLRTDVRRFGKDTPGLLEHVYRTPPMLNAAPHEYLEFSMVAARDSERVHSAPLRFGTLSVKQKGGFKERIQALQARHQHRNENALRLINPVKNPRYDDVYREGVAWLDQLAGEPLKLGEKVVEFADEVWKSQPRKGGDVS